VLLIAGKRNREGSRGKTGKKREEEGRRAKREEGHR